MDHESQLQAAIDGMVREGRGLLAVDKSYANHRQVIQCHQGRVERTEPACLPLYVTRYPKVGPLDQWYVSV